jgi:hypothetical protein
MKNLNPLSPDALKGGFAETGSRQKACQTTVILSRPLTERQTMTTLTNAIAAAGTDLLTALAIQTEATEVCLDDVIMELQVRGEPFPRSLTSADPLAILLARERDGDYAFGH